MPPRTLAFEVCLYMEASDRACNLNFRPSQERYVVTNNRFQTVHIGTSEVTVATNKDHRALRLQLKHGTKLLDLIVVQ